jgi:hypothetical protein
MKTEYYGAESGVSLSNAVTTTVHVHSKEEAMSKYYMEIDLSTIDGNAYAIMGAAQRILKKAGATPEEIDQYLKESMSGDYKNLVETVGKWLVVV